MKLQPGDIIGYKPKATDSLVAFIIKIFGKQRYSHILIYTGDGNVIEAGAKGVSEGPNWVTHKPKDYWRVMRLRQGLDEDGQKEIVEAARAYLDAPYDYWHYPFLGIYSWFSRLGWASKLLKWIKKIDDDKFVNCSEFVARTYWDGINVDLGNEDSFDFTLPDDIMDSELLGDIET